MIDKLVADVAERSAAIRECGLEIVALRRQVQLYIDRERDLRGEVERSKEDNTQESEAIMQAALSGGIGTGAGDASDDVEALKRRLSLLSTKYVKERRSSMALTGQVESLHGTIDRLQQELDAKARAMAAHAKHLKQLETAKDTIRMQERVISKLEALLEKGSRERGSSKGLAASSPSGPSVSHADVKAMESQLRAKDLRIMALESQLSVNAAAYAQELSALRMQAMLRAASARSEQDYYDEGQ